jgi:hypothetical protein
MARKSKKLLFAALTEITGDPQYAEKGLKAKGVGDETYGRDSRIYIHLADMAARQRVEWELERRGFKVHRSYWPGHPTVEASVSYFKGWHHNE